MVYNYIRKPLQIEEADRLCQSCETMQEKLIIWTLLDTGLRISELCSLSPKNIEWQQKALRIGGILRFVSRGATLDKFRWETCQ